jgi:hypothetical protein
LYVEFGHLLKYVNQMTFFLFFNNFLNFYLDYAYFFFLLC